MTIAYADDLVTLHHGDCRDVLRGLPSGSVDAVVTDPPYELGFMGKGWDASGIAYDVDLWREVLRVLKPGGHLLAFGGTRTWHRLACAIEDAGFEIRDSIAWLYGSGFPKSLDVSKTIDKATGAAPESPNRGRWNPGSQGAGVGHQKGWGDVEAHSWEPKTDLSRRWQGWGTALKPAHEPIVVARKPLAGTVAANVLAHGTGALNIDACRIATEELLQGSTVPNDIRGGAYGVGHIPADDLPSYVQNRAGRWPANVVLDEDQAAALDQQSGATGAAAPASGPTYSGPSTRNAMSGGFGGMDRAPSFHGDSGGASRFFYVAKAPSSERPNVDGVAHPTVKPVDLMRWLVRLVTPPDGVVLEPFAGSGTTLEAAITEGFRVIGIEREADYLPLILQRITKPIQQGLDI